jgi:PadR family transcriptional regulator AphA
MDVKTVCLGMLTEGEASGYDLKKAFESSFGHCFAAGYGSIYPALASLAECGCVDCEEIAQEGKPDRKVYRITVKGWEMLHQELANTSPSHKVRSEFLAQMAFAHLMTAEQVQEVLDSRIEDVGRNLKIIEEFENCGDRDWPAGVRFTLGFGRAMLQTMKTYVEENRHMFDDQKDTTKKVSAG